MSGIACLGMIIIGYGDANKFIRFKYNIINLIRTIYDARHTLIRSMRHFNLRESH